MPWAHFSNEDLPAALKALRAEKLHHQAREAERVNKRDKIDEQFFKAAKDKRQKDGEVEFDDDAIVSVSEDKGAYVMAWVWISDEEAGVRRKGS